MDNQEQTEFSLSLPWPVLPVMVPGLAHLTFASLALMGITPNAAFSFTHLLLLIAVFWTALDRKRYEPVVCFIVVLVVSAITDIVFLALYFKILSSTSDLARFSSALVIINLLGKPVTLILSILALYSRRESFGITFSRSGTDDAESDSVQPKQTPATTPEHKPANVVPRVYGQPASYPPPKPASVYSAAQ